jgi:hypothetical protein
MQGKNIYHVGLVSSLPMLVDTSQHSAAFKLDGVQTHKQQ